MPAYKRLTLLQFIKTSDSELIGDLATQNAAAKFPIPPEQIEAWHSQATPLREAVRVLISSVPKSQNWSILFEYPIPRVGKRIDAVLLAERVVVVLEFKTGEALGSGVAQAEDYALSLSYFHEPSHGFEITPFVVGVSNRSRTVGSKTGDVRETVVTNYSELGRSLAHATCGVEEGVPIDAARWDQGKFRPVPPIIDAAVSLYADMDVFEIGHACAAHETLERTTNKIVEAVDIARREGRKVICFVTGVPGAGKTLVGLNAVHRSELKSEASFLSGNRPLVRVLSEALVRDAVRRDPTLSRAEAARRVVAFVQIVHAFAEENHNPDSGAPRQRIIVFDEAQRAWDRERNLSRFDRDMSEPEMLLEIMGRHEGWAVIIALVGGGQEINRGEAGLSEWGRGLEKHVGWHVWVSPDLQRSRSSVAGAKLFENAPQNSITEDPALHLDISMRALRAEHLSDWVNSVMGGETEMASRIAALLPERPLITRSLSTTREWLLKSARGSSRAGLVSSATAMRLRADGIEPSYDFHSRFDWENWFLDGPEDTRSSSRLEVAATQFEIQGLELDWVGVCWGEDLVWTGSAWSSFRFDNKKWVQLEDAVKHQYRVNAYRVLLTRARQGMIIYIPAASEADSSRLTKELDETANLLLASGAIAYPGTSAAGMR